MNSEVDYRSPFDTERGYWATERHQAWITYRNGYVSTGNEEYLNDMLTFVTMHDPPDAPYRPVTGLRIRGPIPLVRLLAVVVLSWVAVFAVIGGIITLTR